MPQLGSLLAQRLVDFTEEREDIRKSIGIPLLIYLRMTVSHRDRDNASEHVQIATTLVIVKPLHVTGMDDQGFLEVRLQIGRQVGLTRLQNLLVARSLIRGCLVIALGHLSWR